jgi:hypothetical protein
MPPGEDPRHRNFLTKTALPGGKQGRASGVSLWGEDICLMRHFSICAAPEQVAPPASDLGGPGGAVSQPTSWENSLVRITQADACRSSGSVHEGLWVRAGGPWVSKHCGILSAGPSELAQGEKPEPTAMTRATEVFA